MTTLDFLSEELSVILDAVSWYHIELQRRAMESKRLDLEVSEQTYSDIGRSMMLERRLKELKK